MLGQDKKNKKAAVYAASTGMFMVVMLIFAVYVYQIQEESQERLISSSIAIQLIDIEDSISDSVAKIYKINNNMTLSINVEDENEIIAISTYLKSSGFQSNLEQNLTMLEEKVSSMFQGIYFNSSAVSNALLNRFPGMAIGKKDNQLLIYYNKSEMNTFGFKGMDIDIKTTEDISNIKGPEPTGSRFLNITARNPTALPPKNYNKYITFNTISSTETWQINNSGDTTTFMQITLDSEKINITALEGDFTIKINFHNKVPPHQPKFYFPKKAIFINPPYLEARKWSTVSFN